MKADGLMFGKNRNSDATIRRNYDLPELPAARIGPGGPPDGNKVEIIARYVLALIARQESEGAWAHFQDAISSEDWDLISDQIDILAPLPDVAKAGDALGYFQRRPGIRLPNPVPW